MAFRAAFAAQPLSPEEFAEEHGLVVSGATVRRWVRGDLPTRMTSDVREAFREYLNGSAGSLHEPAPATAAAGGPRWPDVEPDDPEDVKAYLTFFGAEAEAFRRMSKRLPLSDLAKGCLDDAREEGMSDRSFGILYDRLAHLL